MVVVSCNGCRVLRKGCSKDCLLRQSLTSIHSPHSQSHATLFVAKFFGRSSLFSFLSSTPSPLRPAVFQSLLYEACGRTINPVTGAVGLLCTGKWNLCQSAVEAVLRGDILTPIPDLLPAGITSDSDELSEKDLARAEIDDEDTAICAISRQQSNSSSKKRNNVDLELRLMTSVDEVIMDSPPAPGVGVKRRR